MQLSQRQKLLISRSKSIEACYTPATQTDSRLARFKKYHRDLIEALGIIHVSTNKAGIAINLIQYTWEGFRTQVQQGNFGV